MAKDISLLGANYPGVPAVELPQTGGGTATFYDIQVVNSLDSDSTTDALSAAMGKALNNNITNKFGKNYGTSSNPITTLDDLPMNGAGYVTLADTLSPTGAKAAFSFIKTGSVTSNRYNVLVKRIYSGLTSDIYFGSVYDTTFVGWQKLALNDNIESKTWTPTDNDTLLGYILNTIGTTNLPKTFVKVGNAVVSDAPFGTPEYVVILSGNGIRIHVEVTRYNAGEGAEPVTYRRDIYNGAWRRNSWVPVFGMYELNSTTQKIEDFLATLPSNGNWQVRVTNNNSIGDLVTFSGQHLFNITQLCSDSSAFAKYQIAVSVNDPRFFFRVGKWWSGGFWSDWQELSLNTDTGWVTPVTGCRYRKVGAVCTVHVLNASANADTVLFTLPAGCRPVVDTLVPNYNMVDQAQAYLDIEDDGRVIMKVLDTSKTQYLAGAHCTFIVA